MQTDTGLEADAQTLAAYIGSLKVMRDYDLKRFALWCGDLYFVANIPLLKLYKK